MNAKFKYLLIASALLLPSLANAQALIRREQIVALLGAPITYANLPASPRTGDTYWVSDVNSTCTSGGSTNNVVVGWSGSAWVCLGSVGSGTGGLPALTEDSNSVNSSKAIEIGDVSTNSWEITGTNVTGHKTYDLPNVASAKLGVTTGTLTDNNCPKFSSGALVDTGSPCGTLSGFSINIDNSAGLSGTDSRPKAIRIPFAQTVNKVCATTDADTASVNVQRNDGSPVDMLSSNLTAATTEACTTTFAGSENTLSEGNYIDVVIDSATGTPKQLTISFNTTRN